MICRLLFCVFLLATNGIGQSSSKFEPLDRWRLSVTRNNPASLMELYSSQPPARVTVVTKGSTEISAQNDAEFWAGLKAQHLSLNIAEMKSPQPGIEQVTFQATVRTAPPGRTLYILESQLWQDQAGDWKLVAAQRTDARKLEQPLSLNAKLYPPASGAREEIQQAVARAAPAHKRVLVVFGADWCYDCHVLDKALRRSDIAPVLNTNFQVVHVDVGTGDKNQDLMNQYQVPMSRGIPAIAVLDSTGNLLYSQKNGEFERARAMGPEDLLEFLNKWKPQSR